MYLNDKRWKQGKACGGKREKRKEVGPEMEWKPWIVTHKIKRQARKVKKWSGGKAKRKARKVQRDGGKWRGKRGKCMGMEGKRSGKRAK